MDWDTRVGCYAWVEREGQVLLSHWRGGHTHDGRHLRGGWTLVGGGLELGESPPQAVAREVLEESGYEVRVGEVVASHAHPVAAHDRAAAGASPLNVVQLVFRAEVIGGSLRPERCGSSDEARWVPVAELDDLPCSRVVDVGWRGVGGPGLRQPLLDGYPVDEDAVDQIRAAVDRALAVGPGAARTGEGVFVVAVDGPSGSGKTVLATAVARDLDAPLIHMDDLYPGWDGLAQAPDLLVEQVLEPLARGERAAYWRWDWHAHDWAPEPVILPAPVGGVLVVEGCGSSVGAAGTYADVRVWVEARRAARMRRGIARDGEAFRPHWERWAAQETEVFAADGTRECADVVLDTSPADRDR